MQLSVIIVNYNVRYFLEQALFSVRRASAGLSLEIIVVDNNSSDGSCEMIQEKFPEVKLIQNTVNSGFSKANNQGIIASTGKYVLLLNPDTVVEEDTFTSVLHFMEKMPNCGGLGVKMLDGTGKFLPESKRALPTPAVAFYKIFGLSALFPKSRIFGRYHLAFLDENEIHEVDVLSGAFMLLRREALEKTGLLDEDFFMYGEDIDLSYRITKAGYKNYYFPNTRIIHYKGESTKKSSVNYVFVFYRAMAIFARKHFSHKNASLFSFLINIAIYLRAGVAIFQRFIKKTFLPGLDFIMIYGGLYEAKNLWEQYVQNNDHYYPNTFMLLVMPLYVLTWMGAILMSNGYEKPHSPVKFVKGITYGTIAILLAYALVPEEFRFSRALIILGACWSLVAVLSVRLIFKYFGVKALALQWKQTKNVLIVGNQKESQRVLGLLQQSGTDFYFLGYVKPLRDKHPESDMILLGDLQDLSEIIRLHAVDEVIFCAGDVPSGKIIESMSLLSAQEVEYKIAPPESLYIIGSNSIHNNGELYVIDINSIGKTSNLRNKRVFDLIVAVGILSTLPLNILLVKKRLVFIKNIVKVMMGKRTWVGYGEIENEIFSHLPKLKPSVLTPLQVSKVKSSDSNAAIRMNTLYAKDYKISNDLHILIKAFSELGGV